MALADNISVSFEEYLKMREESNKLLEYIDGVVYMAPSPLTKHQRISSKLQIKMGVYLQGKNCEVY